MDSNFPPLTTLEIDLAAISRNYLFLKSKLAKGADCAAVVKADAYGLGALAVSPVLESQGCRHFFVATFDEGAELRSTLSADSHIYVLHGPHGAAPADFTAHGLVPVLNSLPDISLWAGYAAQTGKKQPAIIHLDTGMNRLGLGSADTPEGLDAIDVRFVMSHLACPDTPEHPMNRAQLERFRARIAGLKGPFRFSLANSAGILLGAEWHFDLARPGCGLYGINPLSHAPNPMQPAVTLKGQILQVRDIAEKGTVGYGATYGISPPAKTAAISLGYADGYFRSLTGRGVVYIDGTACPVVGRVSMDSIVADISALKTLPRPGDYAEVIGKGQTVDDVAAQGGTIGNEVLTALGKIYKRIYKGA